MLEHLPEAVLQDIICIAGWLVEYGRNQGTALFVSRSLCGAFISRCAPLLPFLAFSLSSISVPVLHVSHRDSGGRISVHLFYNCTVEV